MRDIHMADVPLVALLWPLKLRCILSLLPFTILSRQQQAEMYFGGKQCLLRDQPNLWYWIFMETFITAWDFSGSAVIKADNDATLLVFVLVGSFFQFVV